MSEEERQWVLDNVEEICARTNDIDEICCALEHSTIFVTEHLQTLVTDFLKLQYENTQLKSVLKEIREYIKDNISQEFRNGRSNEFYLELNEKNLKILLEIIEKGTGVNNG